MALAVVSLTTRGCSYLVAVEVVRWGTFGKLLSLDARLHGAGMAPAPHHG